MKANEKIIAGIKQTLETGDKITIDLREASALTGSGNNVGGRTLFDDAFAALRFGNPIRKGARIVKRAGQSAIQLFRDQVSQPLQTHQSHDPVVH